MAKIIIFSAPSGAGKSTIINSLLKSGLPLAFSISATSRKPRGAEVDGVEYYFLDEASFRTKIADGEFLEYEEVYSGTFYGTLKSELDRIASQGKYTVFDVDVKGGVRIKQLFGEDALSIFIMPPSMEVLEARLRSRSTDSEESIQKRIARAELEIAYSEQFDKVIVNDKLEDSIAETAAALSSFLK